MLLGLAITASGLHACKNKTDNNSSNQESAASNVFGAFDDAETLLLKPAIMVAGKEVQGVSLNQRMETYQTPGVSLALFDADGLLMERTYGFAALDPAVPLGSSHIFQAASISKAITAIAVMRLVEQGILDLDADVRDYLASWELPVNEVFDQSVTLRRLLSHNAGITVHGFQGYEQQEELPSLQQSLSGIEPANNPPVFIGKLPGESFGYSGGGYLIIQQIVEDVTERPFREMMDEMVLQPVGMRQTSFDIVSEANSSSKYARGYSVDDGVLQGGWRVYPEAAAAGIWTTAIDLAKLGSELLQIHEGKTDGILSHASLVEMTRLTAGSWGLGVRVSSDRQIDSFGHGGNNFGYSSDFLVVSGAGQGVVILTNGDAELGALVGEIRKAIAEIYGWAGLGPEVRTPANIPVEKLVMFAGSYQESSGFTFAVIFDGDELFINAAPLGPKPVRLYPQTEHRFFVLPSGLPFEFYLDDQGNVDGVKIGSRDAKRLQ